MIAPGTHVTKKDLEAAEKARNKVGDDIKKARAALKVLEEAWQRANGDVIMIQGALKYGNGVTR